MKTIYVNIAGHPRLSDPTHLQQFFHLRRRPCPDGVVCGAHNRPNFEDRQLGDQMDMYYIARFLKYGNFLEFTNSNPRCLNWASCVYVFGIRCKATMHDGRKSSRAALANIHCTQRCVDTREFALPSLTRLEVDTHPTVSPYKDVRRIRRPVVYIPSFSLSPHLRGVSESAPPARRSSSKHKGF